MNPTPSLSNTRNAFSTSGWEGQDSFSRHTCWVTIANKVSSDILWLPPGVHVDSVSVEGVHVNSVCVSGGCTCGQCV